MESIIVYQLSIPVYQIARKLSGLKQQALIVSRFLWVRYLEVAWLDGTGSGFLSRGESKYCRTSHLKSGLGPDGSILRWLIVASKCGL